MMNKNNRTIFAPLQRLVRRIAQWLFSYRIIYGLSTEGDSINGWKFKMRYKLMFLTRRSAERNIPQFEARCYDRNFFEVAKEGTLKTKVDEYELYV